MNDTKWKVYRCPHCGSVMLAVTKEGQGPELGCCGEKMQEIVPNTTEASVEKHVPVVHVDDGVLRAVVGSVAHPMSAEHSIEWIALETSAGCYLHRLTPGDQPQAEFALKPDEVPGRVLAYCNLHGLWAVQAGARGE